LLLSLLWDALSKTVVDEGRHGSQDAKEQTDVKKWRTVTFSGAKSHDHLRH
jgi:hypothetical protein